MMINAVRNEPVRSEKMPTNKGPSAVLTVTRNVNSREADAAPAHR